MIITALLVVATLAQASPQAPASALAPGARIYVQPSDRAAVRAEVVTALKDWGRWTVVEQPADATLFATLKLTGSGSKGTMRLTVTETPDGPTLWQGYDEGRKRGKNDAYTRTLAVIMEQLRGASERWPVR